MKHKCLGLFLLVFLSLTTALQAQVTSLSLTGQPGDFILGGQSKFFTPADGTFSVHGTATGGVVTVTFFSATSSGLSISPHQAASL